MKGTGYTKIIHNLVVPETLSDEEKRKSNEPLMDYLKAHTPDKLFRFRGCKERTLNEFDLDILGFSPASEMNDDFDGMLYFDKERIKSKLFDAVTPKKINSMLESISKGTIPEKYIKNIPEDALRQMAEPFFKHTTEEISLISNKFTDFVTEDYDKRMTFLSQVTQNQKIACLSESIESAAMWGYYAQNGTGFALSYDLRVPDFSEYTLLPIIYGTDRFDATEYTEWLFQQQIIQRILFKNGLSSWYQELQHMIPCPDLFMATKILIHKAISWQHEKEWRLVYTPKNDDSRKYPYISKKPSALYLGKNISAIHEKILRHIAVEKNIPVYKMMICEENHTYNLIPKLL